MDIQSPKLLVVWKRNYIKTYVLYTILNCYSAISVCILNCRFDVSTVELLLWYEAIFGREMWKHVVSETTFWSHSEESVDLRMQERGQVCSFFLCADVIFLFILTHKKTVIYFLIGKCPNLYIWKYRKLCSFRPLSI